MDDGVLAGERSAVVCALHLIEELGPHLGLHINLPKCVMWSPIIIGLGTSLWRPVVGLA